MELLIFGVLLWSVLHWSKAIAPVQRARLIDRLGAKAYRGLFSLGILLSLVIIGFGWAKTDIKPVYVPPLYGNHLVIVLVFVAFLLFAAAETRGNIKRFIRHPMLTGLMVWAAAHLLANGDNRSIVLFGGLGLWAFISIILINRRDGAWQRPAAAPLSQDAKTVVGAIVVFSVVLMLHKYLFGVSPLVGM